MSRRFRGVTGSPALGGLNVGLTMVRAGAAAPAAAPAVSVPIRLVLTSAGSGGEATWLLRYLIRGVRVADEAPADTIVWSSVETGAPEQYDNSSFVDGMGTVCVFSYYNGEIIDQQATITCTVNGVAYTDVQVLPFSGL